MKSPNDTLAKGLKIFRAGHGFSQQEIASFLGIAQKTWSNYECGRTLPPVTLLERLREMGFDYRTHKPSMQYGQDERAWSKGRNILTNAFAQATMEGADPDDLIQIVYELATHRMDSLFPAKATRESRYELRLRPKPHDGIVQGKEGGAV